MPVGPRAKATARPRAKPTVSIASLKRAAALAKSAGQLSASAADAIVNADKEALLKLNIHARSPFKTINKDQLPVQIVSSRQRRAFVSRGYSTFLPKSKTRLSPESLEKIYKLMTD
jgi:hypothetical protein